MSKLLTFAVRHTRGFLVLALAVLIVFAFSYALHNPAGFSRARLLEGFGVGGSFLMTLESPRSLGFPIWLGAMAWVVCFTGWLMVPLLASALISESLKEVDKEKYYIAKFTLLARKMGVPENKIREFVKEAMRLKDNLLEQ